MNYIIEIIKLIIDNSDQNAPNRVIGAITSISKEIESGSFVHIHYKFDFSNLDNGINSFADLNNLTKDIVLGWINSTELQSQLADAYIVVENAIKEMQVMNTIASIDPPWGSTNINQSGSISYPEEIHVNPLTIEQAIANKLQEIAAWRYNKETSGLFYANNIFDTSRESRSQLIIMRDEMINGNISSANWKTKDGYWVSMNLEMVTGLISAIAAFVQQCFDQEKMYYDMVYSIANSNGSIEDIMSIIPETVYQL